jgi:hypothetical protein
MRDLFNKQDAGLCSLVSYVDTFLNEKNENYNLFQLPPIQRNAVWNVAQIERLWDSILRGFPIGSFLAARRKAGNMSRDLSFGIQKQSDADGYFLLDGQQRTRGILLGFSPNQNSRLWIDLNPSLIFDNQELNDRKFLLRVVTTYQPWGMSDRNPADKLSEPQKYNAREELGIESLHYDYQVKIDLGKVENDESYSWPVKAELPIPLDILINLCGGMSGRFVLPTWTEICEHIPLRYHRLGQVTLNPPAHLHDILQALSKIIDTTNERSRSVVLLQQNETINEHAENEKDSTEVLFTRVNAGGTTLQGEEMAYSLLKSSWDGAYEMVSKIVKNDAIGYLLPATGIVMAASRLARFIMGESDVANPGVANFRRWIGEKNAEPSFLDTMKNLLFSSENNQSIFHNTIEAFCNLVIYNESIPNDIGFPRKLLLSINQSLYLPVFVWIYKHLEDKPLLEKNRKNILRYLVYCYLTVDSHQKASKVALDVITDSTILGFPDKKIYEALIEAELSAPIPTPEQYFKPFEDAPDGFFRHYNDVFNIEDDQFNSCRIWFWEAKDLLLWFQRSYAAKWFVGYNPMSGDHYDTPYDWDHIVPYSHLITSGASPDTHSENNDLNNKFTWNRHRYINSIGNFRLWPFWANRGDNNKCHTYKLRMEEPHWENDLIAKELDLHSIQDFLNASAINLVDEELWYNSGVYDDIRNWPQQRRESWQKAVENRVYYLYNIFYTDFGFSSWKTG